MEMRGIELSQAAKDFLLALGLLHDENKSLDCFTLSLVKQKAGYTHLSLMESMCAIRSLRTSGLVFDRQYGFKISPLGENLLPSLRQEAVA